MFKLSKMITVAMLLSVVLNGANNIDIGVSKNIDNSSIVTMTPRPIEDVLPNSAIEIVFNQALDSKHIKKNDIKVQSLSNPSYKVEGEIEYDEANKKLSFIPSTELPEGIYEVSYHSLKFENKKPLDTISYRFTVSQKVEINNDSPNKPILRLRGNEVVRLLQGEKYIEDGITAFNTTSYETIGSVDTSTIGSYTITYIATNKATKEQTSISRTVNVVSPYGVDIDTNIRKANATLFLSLRSQPTDNVTIEVVFDNPNEVKAISGNPITFTPDNWRRQKSIVIEGLNPDSEGRQEYNISFKPIVSKDSNYDGVQLDTIEKKSPEIVLEAPNTLRKLIPFSQEILPFKVHYNGHFRKLSYRLVEAPQGMSISHTFSSRSLLENESDKYLSWSVPESAQGKEYPVRIEVSDGITTKYAEFNVSVAVSRILETQFDGEYLNVTDESSSLEGVKFKFLTDNPIIHTLKVLPENQVTLNPDSSITRITDFFYAASSKDNEGSVDVCIPLSSKLRGYDLGRLDFYYFDESRQNWISTAVNWRFTLIDNQNYLVLKVGSLVGSPIFIGLRPEIVQTKTKKSRNRVANPISPDVNCSTWHEVVNRSWIKHDECFIQTYPDLNITIVDFGDSIDSYSLWTPSTSISDIITWIGEAKSVIDNLGMTMTYDNIVLRFDPNLMTSNKYGKTQPGAELANMRVPNTNTIRIANNRNQSQDTMKTVVVHEYFHHAQINTLLANVNGTHLLNGININNVSTILWIVEGSAFWFQDYLYDTINWYKYYYQHYRQDGQLLKNGLASDDTDYRTSFFLKLLTSKCTNFIDEIPYLFYADFQNDPIRIKNFITRLNNQSCNVPNFLKMDNLAHTMLYYQYATALESNIELLDSQNEVPFDFVQAVDIPQDKWQIISDYFQNDLLGHSQVANYGAYSFKIPNIKDLNSSIQITAKTDKPLTIVGVHLDENNKATPSGIYNKFFFQTKANESTTFTVTKEAIRGGFFITLLNPTEEDVTLLDLNISKTSRFVKLTNSDRSYVLDTNTSLLWEDMDEGFKTWTDAKNYCENLWSYQYDSKIGEDWRLPTLEELYTIYNEEGASHVYKEFDELSEKPFGYWSSNTLLISVMNWYTFSDELKPAAIVLMYEDNYERNFELRYDMNVMCVTNFVE